MSSMMRADVGATVQQRDMVDQTCAGVPISKRRVSPTAYCEQLTETW